MDNMTPRFIIEYRLGSTWNPAAQVIADDLAKAALEAFRKASPSVEWRITE